MKNIATFLISTLLIASCSTKQKAKEADKQTAYAAIIPGGTQWSYVSGYDSVVVKFTDSKYTPATYIPATYTAARLDTFKFKRGGVIITPPPPVDTTTNPVVRQNLILDKGFEGANPFSGLSTDQANTSTSIQASTKYAHEGTQSFRAEVKQNDPPKSSGYRAELTGFPADQGERWYGWSMYFETPASNGNWTGGYGGHVVQWHPDNSSGSASLALWGSDGVWDVCVNPTGSGSVSHQSKTAAGGSLEKIQVGKWYDIVMHVKWSAGTDGIIEMWKNGVLYFKQTGKATTTTGVYFKFGMNRWSMTNDWVIYYDNLRIGNANATYKDVAPEGSVQVP